jgi:probable HAF family extracellular repeat protein
MLSVRTLAGASALAISVSAHAGVTYKVLDSGVVGLGVVLGNGTIAGNTGPYDNIAFRVDSNGAVTTLPDLGSGAEVLGGSSSGLVAGTRWTDNPNGGIPTIWGLDGTPTSLPTLGGGYGSVYSINGSGDAVGSSGLAGAGVYWSHAALYHAGAVTDLTPSTNAYSVAFAINEHGAIAGAFEPTSTTGYHAFVYAQGTFTDIGMSGTHDSSYAKAINGLGHLAGEQSTSSPQSGVTSMTGFLYRDGAFVEINPLPNYPFNYAFGINDKDAVVGYSTSNFQSFRGWIWSKGKTSDLTALLRPADSGWIVERAMGIDDRGRIVGTGLKNGVEHAILLQPLKAR